VKQQNGRTEGVCLTRCESTLVLNEEKEAESLFSNACKQEGEVLVIFAVSPGISDQADMLAQTSKDFRHVFEPFFGPSFSQWGSSRDDHKPQNKRIGFESCRPPRSLITNFQF